MASEGLERPDRGTLKFKFPFRSHQTLILDRFEQERRQTPKGEPLRYHVVAPPGAGKTIVGIEMAIRLGEPCMVVCPNTAIQGQWAKKLEMFVPGGHAETAARLATTDAARPRWLTVLTYQILSIPEDAGEGMIEIAEGIWTEALLEAGMEEEDARGRIARMKESNAPAYRKEMAKYTKKVRDGKLEELLSGKLEPVEPGVFPPASANTGTGNASGMAGPTHPGIDLREPEARFLGILHPNTRKLLQGLKAAGIRTVIFDECHHLQTWWATVMKHLLRWMGVTNVIGLTATPPIDENAAVLENYIGLLGPIDFEIPTPAVVKDGMLAPYQDLLYLCRPQEAEWSYLQNCHGKFRELLVRFAQPESDFCRFMQQRMFERKLSDGTQREWKKFYTARKEFATAGIKYLHSAGIRIPADIGMTPAMTGHPTLEEWTRLVEDYALTRLKLSGEAADLLLYEEIRDALYALGFILTEKGVRTYISPLDRVLAYSRSKLTAVRDILVSEMRTMGSSLRAAVVTDFEFSNALSLKQLDRVLDSECGGAVSVMKMMVADPELDKLNPIMVTGKSLLCAEGIAEAYRERFLEWAKAHSLQIRLDLMPSPDGTFVSIEGSGRDWNTRSAILFTTSVLEEGFTRCIIGTRGLLGEGWDSVSLNTLIDLSVATTYASVNQLRGRSIRKDDNVPRKLANNWDVVCYAPELEKGINDAVRLGKKHAQFYGICQDGSISKGTAHLDPRLALSERMEMDEANAMNTDMLTRSGRRDPTYDLWRIGEPFHNVEQASLEFRLGQGEVAGDLGMPSPQSAALRSKSNGLAMQGGAGALAAVAAVIAAGISLPVTLAAGAASALLLFSGAKGVGRVAEYGRKEAAAAKPEVFAKRISLAVFGALVECGLMPRDQKQQQIVVSTTDGGAVRVFFDGTPELSSLFSKSLDEVLSPIADQRYAVPRYETPVPEKKGSFAMLRSLLNPGDPVLAGYHPIPNELGLNKERALVFQQHWNRHVSRGEMVYLRGAEGQAVLEQYALTDPLQVQKQVAAIWR